MGFPSIRVKILISLLMTTLLFGLGMVMFAETVIHDKLHQKLSEKGEVVAKRVAADCISPVITEHYFEIAMMFKDLMASEKDIIYAYVLSEDDRELASTFAHGVPQELKLAHQANLHQPYSTKKLTTDLGIIHDIAVPLMKGEIGVLHMGLSDAAIRKDVNDIVLLIVLFSVAVLIMVTALSIGVSRIISRPLVKLAQAAEAFGRGEMGHRIFIDSADEVGELATVFNVMVERRKRTEDALHESVAFQNSLLNAIPIPVFYKDRDGRYLGFNKAFETFFGATQDRLIGKSVFDINPPELAAIYHAKDAELIESGGVQQYESQMKNERGVVRDVIFNKAVFLDSQGAIIGLIGAILDITERKQAVEVLREREAFIHNILDSVDEGFIVIDRQYRILSVNQAFCRMMQVSEEQVLGRPCYEISHQASRPCFELGEDCAVRRSFETGKVHAALHSHADSFEVKHHVELKTFPITDGDGTVVSVIETLNDVTDKVKLEEQLRQAQKMEAIGTLAGGVSHDFNNMLGVIIGHTEMVMRKMDPADPFFASLQEIRNAAGRSADLTRQLLAFARKQTVVPKVLDLNVTLEGMLKMLRRLIGEDIDLAWLPGSGLWPVLVDPSQIDQILANLCVNARDAIAGVGKVTIETRNAVINEAYCAEHPEVVAGEYLLLSVSDNGCGMDRLTAGKVFEPFFTTKELGKGTGLGLSTVYGIVKQNNGFVNVYSELGHGSTFNIYLPRHDAKIEEIPQESRALPMARGHETILLVEDEAAILDMTRQMLEGIGYRVLTASTPAEAIRLAREHHGEIRLLLTDVVMPEMNGQELAKKLLGLYPEIKPLFMSGYAGNIIHRHGELDEGDNFIQKPFSILALAAKIREVLDTA